MNLRTRLLIGVGLVALVQVVAALVVVSTTSDRLLDQLDDRLQATAMAAADDPTAPIAALGDAFQGVLRADGTVLTVRPATNRGEELPPPAIDLDDLAEASGPTVTVDAAEGGIDFRLLRVEADDGQALLLATPLDGYERTMNQLIQLVLVVFGAVVVVLGLVAWWVLRLGIRPIVDMTGQAEQIAAGDFSIRIDEADPATEAGQLGGALNTMMGHIEESFDQRTRAEAKLRDFIAAASHELRTPVATIRGYAELHQAGGLADPAELDDAMRRTTQESERMSRLIADMLDLAKLDREPTLRDGPVDLGSLARDVARDAEAMHLGRAVRVEVGAAPLVVTGDEDLLRQALINLVGNAIVHTDEPATVTVSADVDGGHVVVTVSDDGHGMSPDVVERATERFFRADPSRSRARGGSGLGLAIVASIVEAHLGELTIRSELGAGTEVAMRVPRERTQASRRNRVASPSGTATLSVHNPGL